MKLFAAAAFSAPWAPQTLAQPYPSKPVRIVVPTAPGGGTDLVGRVLAQRLTEAFGQPFVVDNRGGAGTTLGTAHVARSAADGYTLLLNHNSLAFNATHYRKLPYDTLKDFTGVSLLAAQPFLLVVHPSLPVRSVRDLIAIAKKRAGQLAYASGGAGSGPYMSVELLKHLAGMDLLHVPYKGAGPAAIDLIAGNVQLMIGTLSLTLPHVNSGRLRALGITSVKRHPALPALPAVGETVAGYRFEVWYALFAPAGTPPAVVQRLNAAVAQTMDTATTREKLAAEGLEIVTGSPDEASAHLRRELDVWARVVKAIGQYAD